MKHLCECGCGGEVKWSKQNKRWNRFIRGHTTKNKKMSQETKAKISKAHKGMKHSEEVKVKMSKSRRGENNPFYGKTMSEEHKLKLLEINTGRITSDETKRKLSEAGKGRVCTKETRIKISKANSGIVRSKETGEKISKTKKNKPLDEQLELALRFMKCRTDGYCDSWSDEEFKEDIRKSACENCGITNMMHIKLFGSRVCNHHIDGNKMNCHPSNFRTLCASCHAKADWILRKGEFL